MASLDVKGVIEMAWCPAILKGLRDTKCSRNLYQLTLNDFRGRRAVLSNKRCKIEMNLTNRFQKCEAAESVFWKIQHNSLLNLRYTNHRKQ